jgi:hypothetical protein
MQIFKIPVFWMMSATIEVQADNLEEAREKVLNNPGDTSEFEDYIDDSMTIDEDLLDEYIKEEQGQK